MFVAAGLALALVTIWLRRDLRRNMLGMAVAMGVGLVGLIVLARYRRRARPTRRSRSSSAKRCCCWSPSASPASRMMFLFQGVLARFAIPRILADVLIAVVLIVFALYRMNAVGVNLAGIITTSAVITGVIAFSLQETLGNLWGGIALQLDNTCRIGDWIRMEGVSGQVVGIRWRYMAIATNNGETVDHPERPADQEPRDRARAPRRRARSRGGATSSSRSTTTSRRRGSSRRSTDGARARRDPQRRARPARSIVMCTGFGDSGDPVRGPLLADRSRARHVDRFAGPPARRRDARAHRHGDPVPAPRADPRARAPDAAGAPRARARRARCATLAQIELFASLTDGERHALAAELAGLPVRRRRRHRARRASRRIRCSSSPAAGCSLRRQRRRHRRARPARHARRADVLRRDGAADRAAARRDGRRAERRALLPARQGAASTRSSERGRSWSSRCRASSSRGRRPTTRRCRRCRRSARARHASTARPSSSARIRRASSVQTSDLSGPLSVPATEVLAR